MGKTDKLAPVRADQWRCPWCRTVNPAKPYSTRCQGCRYVNHVVPAPKAAVPRDEVPWWAV